MSAVQRARLVLPSCQSGVGVGGEWGGGTAGRSTVEGVQSVGGGDQNRYSPTRGRPTCPTG